MQPEIGVMFRREQHPGTLIDYARQVEALGFDQLWVVEDCFYMGGIAQAAMALTATSQIKVGIGINPAVARNPAFLAMEYATLVSAFPGRLIGGIGHGFGGWMEQVGVKPASWLRSMEEIVSSVQRILRGEEVTADGAYAKLNAVQLFDPPAVVPPILLGVQAEKSLRLAGTIADGVVLAEGAGPDYIQWAREQLVVGRAAANRDDDPVVVTYAYCLVDESDPAGAKAQMRDLLVDQIVEHTGPRFAQTSFADELARLVEEGGADALRAGLRDEWLHDLALAGSTDEARASIARLGEAGANAVVLVPPEDADWDAWLGNPFMREVATRT